MTCDKPQLYIFFFLLCFLVSVILSLKVKIFSASCMRDINISKYSHCFIHRMKENRFTASWGQPFGYNGGLIFLMFLHFQQISLSYPAGWRKNQILAGGFVLIVPAPLYTDLVDLLGSVSSYNQLTAVVPC